MTRSPCGNSLKSMQKKSSGKGQNGAKRGRTATAGEKAGSPLSESGKGWRPSVNPYVIAVCVTLAAFMEILDTTIVNVALPYIAGSLAVSSDQANYALTSYLVANGIVLTISGWMSDTIGRKRYFLTCLAMFTACSFLCGISQSLAQIIVFRAFQGLFGGGLQPNQQSIILDTFEPAKRGSAFAITAIATIVAPVLGPTLGGYLTVHYGWRWIFFVNIPVGVFAVIANFFVVEDPPWEREKQKRTRGIDYIGLALISLGLGCLQVMLDRGEDDNWFGSGFICIMGLFAFLGIFGAICWLLAARKPIVKLDVFKDRNFSVGCVLVGAMGAILYSSGVVIPQFAQQVLGYDAYLSGLILSPGGLVIIVLIPIVGRIMKVVQTRYIVMFGFTLMSIALFYASGIVPDIDYRTLALMRTAQTTALGFLFVPISQLAYLTLPKQFQSDGAALFSMFRNVMGAVGISLATAMVTEWKQADEAHLSQFMTPLQSEYNNYIQKSEVALRALGRAPGLLHEQAVSHLYQVFHAQASVLAYSNLFFYTSVLTILVVPICFLISKKKAVGRGGGH